MIWMYIIGAIVAQAIVVVLLNEYMNRRGQYPAEKPQEENAPPAPSPSTVSETKESVPQTISPAIADDAVGLSNFSVADLKAMMEEVVKPIRDCVETLMDEKDAEFDVKNEIPTPPKRMSPEREARAWEDHRDEEAQLEREDNTVAPPNPLASGVDFDSITKASDILQSGEQQPVGALQFAMNVFRTVDGTQFSGCLPDALLEKLYECHRKVEMNDEAFRQEEPESEIPAAEPIPEKEPEVRQKEVKPEPKAEPVIEPEVKDAPAPRFRMEFLRKPSQSKN